MVGYHTQARELALQVRLIRVVVGRRGGMTMVVGRCRGAWCRLMDGLHLVYGIVTLTALT